MNTRNLLFVSALTLVTATVAQGQTYTEYDTRAAFEAASGPLTCVTFEGFAHATFITTQYLPDVEFVSGHTQVLANDPTFPNDQFGATPFFDGGPTSRIRLEFPTPVRSLGAHIPGTTQIDIFDVQGGTLLYTSSELGKFTTFGGVVSDTPFGYAELYRDNPPQNEVFVDDICFAVEAECLLVVGDIPGATDHLELGHLFETQVGPTVEGSYAVTMSSVPTFVLPYAPATTRSQVPPGGGLGMAGAAAVRNGPTPSDTPAWMLDGQFAVQVVMWNPQVFPALPEQSTTGLFVTLSPDGTVKTVPFGTSVGGLEIWHELGVDEQGRQTIRFPFSIPGF